MPPRRSVFVVDDDPSMRTSMTRLLREYGFEATLFDSPSALLGHGEFGGVSCVVLDIDLNGESGIELRRRLADQGVKVPVIYITGNDTDMIRSAATGSGCIVYLIKPLSAKSFIESVERACAGVQP